MHEVCILLGAEIEIQEAYDTLLEAYPDRAQTFEAALDHAFQQLSNFPRSGSIYAGVYRRLLLTDFPYAVFYSIHKRRIFIQALVDSRKDPSSIQRRLEADQ